MSALISIIAARVDIAMAAAFYLKRPCGRLRDTVAVLRVVT